MSAIKIEVGDLFYDETCIRLYLITRITNTHCQMICCVDKETQIFTFPTPKFTGYQKISLSKNHA